MEAFEVAEGDGDIKAALAQFTDDAVVTLEEGTSTISYRGKEQVQNYLATFGAVFTTVARSTAVIDGNRVTWTEYDRLDQHMWNAEVTAMVSQGQITALWYAESGADTFVPDNAATVSKAGQLPSIAWPAALGLVSMLVLGLVFRPSRRTTPRSQLDGRLLKALRHQRHARMSERAA